MFRHTLNSVPGQFIMLWIPGLDEKPMAVAQDDGKILKIGVAKVGRFTTHLFNRYKVGDRLGIRGPYGNGFKLPESADPNPRQRKRIALVGGGFGTPPLVFLAQEARKKKIEVDFIEGARSADLLLYLKEIKKLGVRVHVSTDDGSEGFKGYAPQVLEQLLEKNKYDGVYSCGPEVMMKKVAELASEYNVDCQLSLERFMKCGFGICGACCMDNTGFRVCIDGPVIQGEKALKLPEFGNYSRDSGGNKK